MTSSSKLARYIPLCVWIAAVFVVIAIPLKIMSLAYLPPDDALRHAARAVTGRPWSEILVLGDAWKLEHNFGWHGLLRGIHCGLHTDAEGLVVFSFVALFMVVGLAGLLWRQRPEAWLAALILVVSCDGLMGRFMLGRPFLLTIAALIVVLRLWQERGASLPGWREVGIMTAAMGIAGFVHGCWYLWALPVGAFILAQQWRWAAAAAASWVLGTVLGALFTGHPVDFIWQALEMAIKGLGLHLTQRTMVSEFQPTTGDGFALILLAGVVVLRSLAKLNAAPLARNPVFWLVCLGWALGFKAGRFWYDWGGPALLVLVAAEVQAWMEARVASDSLHRVVLACGLAGTFFLTSTNDANSRWTYSLATDFLTPDHPRLAGWLPENGGTLYSPEMGVFYRTFYKNPDAQWRYILGFEPIFMPREDFEVYHRIVWNRNDPASYEPWVRKMKPADRLVVRADTGVSGSLRQLEWNCAVGGVCIGRLPRADSSQHTP